ncbi:MAG: Rnase Y domain-containing protein, partial [Minisyncoccia bacterium]
MNNPTIWGGLIFGLLIGYLIRIIIASQKRNTLEQKLQELKIKAEAEAKEIILDAKKQAANILEKATIEERERKQELRRLENRLLNKEDELHQELKKIDEFKKSNETFIAKLKSDEEKLKTKEKEIIDINTIPQPKTAGACVDRYSDDFNTFWQE